MSANDERISNKSVDLGEFNKERLLEMFPIFRTEGGGVDFDRLKLALGESVEVGKEVFGMRWPGKADSIRLANTPSHGTLSPDEKESVNFDTTQNLIIEGDNLEVLKLLQKSYQGKVKMIYIDPPYNTGNDFVYEDDFADGIKNYLQQTGQIDDEGNRLSTNSETDGRFHSNWLNLIYPRLVVAHELLKNDGVIFISINDVEVSRLQMICDEIFGDENFVAQIPWQARTSVQNDTDISAQHEYVLVYAKNRRVKDRRLKESNLASWFNEDTFAVIPNPSDPSRFTNPDGDERGPWKADPFDAPNIRPNLTYAIKNPITGEDHWPPNGRHWRTEESAFKELLRTNRIVFGRSGEGRPQLKVFYEEKKVFGEVPTTWFSGEKAGTTSNGTADLERLFGSTQIFPFPKPVSLIELLLLMATRNGDLVLDFFAGSGTTAHAVMALNAKDGGKRKFILVQLPEQVDPESEAAKAGFDNIADITKERVRRAGKKIIEESDGKLKLKGEEALDFGFRVLKLNESNIEDWNSEEASKSPKDLLDALKTTRLKSGRSEQDVIFEVLVKYGIELTSKVEEQKVGKGSVWKIAGGDLIVVVAPGLANADLNAIVKMSPKVVVMLDEAFVPEALKTNARATFKDAKIELKTF